MSMPFYVAPEQRMKDLADYARKGIARGRSLVAVGYADGIAIVATVTDGGWARLTDDELATVFESIAAEVRAR